MYFLLVIEQPLNLVNACFLRVIQECFDQIILVLLFLAHHIPCHALGLIVDVLGTVLDHLLGVFQQLIPFVLNIFHAQILDALVPPFQVFYAKNILLVEPEKGVGTAYPQEEVGERKKKGVVLQREAGDPGEGDAQANA